MSILKDQLLMVGCVALAPLFVGGCGKLEGGADAGSSSDTATAGEEQGVVGLRYPLI